MSLFYSNPLGGRVGFFLQFCASPMTPWLDWIVLIFMDFAANFLVHFPLPTLAHFLIVVYFFNMIWIFLWHINGFNVRQEIQKNSNNSAKSQNRKHTVLTHWSLAQAGLNDEKNGGRKSRWTVPFKGLCFERYIYIPVLFILYLNWRMHTIFWQNTSPVVKPLWARNIPFILIRLTGGRLQEEESYANGEGLIIHEIGVHWLPI